MARYDVALVISSDLVEVFVRLPLILLLLVHRVCIVMTVFRHSLGLR